MKTSIKKIASALLLSSAAMNVSAAKINLFDIGGVAGTQAEQGFAIAANFWEQVLTNDVVLNFNVGFSSLPPNVLGGTSSERYVVDTSAYYGALAASQTSSLDAMAVSNLSPLSSTGSVEVLVPEYIDPTKKLGVATTGERIAPDAKDISQAVVISSANLKALIGGGEGDIDGTIQFSSDYSFDFDPTNGIQAGQTDFIGVAVHEIGHALGFLSGVDLFDYNVGPLFETDEYAWGHTLDLFRYSAPGMLDWTFNSDSYFSLDGGANPYVEGLFSQGSEYGDGFQASHWKANLTCSNFLGIMNPYLCSGTESRVSALDLGLFDAIGWDLNVDVMGSPEYSFTSSQMYMQVVSEPSVLALMGLSISFVFGMRKRKK